MKIKVISATLFLLTLVACHGGGGNQSGPSIPSGPGAKSGDVLTYHNDNFRTGQNNHETSLTVNNVNPTDFGRVAALPVDGIVYAQPLVVQGVSVQSKPTDIVLVATEHDSVYAFDAEKLSATPVWHRSFLGDSVAKCNQCRTLKAFQDVSAPNIWPEVGITATPVIDAAAGIVYVVAATAENNIPYVKLHGLELATGAEIPGSPVIVSGAIPGHGEGFTSDNKIHFDPRTQLSRSGLALSGNSVVFGFSSYDDSEPAHGWLFAYNKKTLAQQSAWMSTPNSGLGTIWMSGGAPVVDTNGDLFFATANGDPAVPYANDYDTSVVRVSNNNGALATADFFKPFNYAQINQLDADLGSGGVLALPDQSGPHPHLLIAGGKGGAVYVLNRDHLGKVTTEKNPTTDSQIVQEIQHALPGGTSDGPGNYSTPAYFNQTVYYCGSGDYLRAFPLSNGQLETSGEMKSHELVRYRGSSPSISSDGGTQGIIWILDPSAFTYNSDGVSTYTVVSNGPSVLIAYNASDLSKPLYRSDTQGARDNAGFAVKFAVPTVALGKVFVGTDTELSVFGLFSQVGQNAKRSPSRAIAGSTSAWDRIQSQMTTFFNSIFKNN